MTAITTTAAATHAGVTPATIRTWCRRNVIAATKNAGRWVIDTASLAHRIAIGARKAKPATPAAFSLENMTAIGGNEWIRGDKHRVYINNWYEFAGLEVDTYKTGNISSATWQGDLIANRQAGLLLGSIDKIWFDTADGQIHGRLGHTDSRVATREQVWQAVIAGIRAAIAAL